jgi:hypothetical protein
MFSPTTSINSPVGRELGERVSEAPFLLLIRFVNNGIYVS